MRIISDQVENLRNRADELRMLASGMDAPYIVPSTKLTMAYAMSSAAAEMREAADTIEGLRDRLQSDALRGACEVSGTTFWEWSDYTAYYEHELSCGHAVRTMEPEPPNYCEECGAKVRKAVGE